jgi:hypothetical protein
MRLQAILGDEATLVGSHALVHYFFGQLAGWFRGFAHVAGIKGRLRVVFDSQLNGFGPVAARKFAGQPQSQIDAGRYASGGNDLPHRTMRCLGSGLAP